MPFKSEALYEPQVGDRVRVVTEGEVTYVDADGRAFDIGESGGFYYHTAPEVISVEKIEPPVETFKPGDVVQSRWASSTSPKYLITDDGGHVILDNGHVCQCGMAELTSSSYERVRLEEAPF